MDIWQVLRLLTPSDGFSRKTTALWRRTVSRPTSNTTCSTRTVYALCSGSFHQDSFFYNAKQDYYVCPMGQHMERIGTKRDNTGNGYQTESARYRAQNCEGCPLRGTCFRAKGNRVIEVLNHRLKEYKRKASERLTSEDGIKHRGRRCIEPEAVFGQMKADYGDKRFRHFGKDKVEMDFAFFPISPSILKKMCRKLKKAV